MLRWKWLPILVCSLIAIGSYLGCDTSEVLPLDGSPNEGQIGNSISPGGFPVSTTDASLPPAINVNAAPPPRNNQNILIASFNIQAFGEKKSSSEVMLDKIATVIRMFDVVAVQEVRDRSQQSIPKLIRKINSQGVHYDFLIGPPLGRTSSKEQYVYIYDTARIKASEDATYTVNDGHPGQASNQQAGDPALVDLLHREPLVARFVTKLPELPFRFTLINVHTDPDEVASEVNVLHDVFLQVRNFEYAQAGEDDVIMMGDFNAGPNEMKKLGSIGLQFAINSPTNVTEKKIYDNILFDPQVTNEFTNRSGVLSLRALFGLSVNDAKEISDHNPVWAEFRIGELPNGLSQMAKGKGFFQR